LGKFGSSFILAAKMAGMRVAYIQNHMKCVQATSVMTGATMGLIDTLGS
jgi:hypothetical protein